MRHRHPLLFAASLGGISVLLGLVAVTKTGAIPPLTPSVFLPELLQLENEPVGTPARLRIPRINVDALVEQVGKNEQGDMDVPSTYDHVAWYSPGSRPGALGNAVIAGHLDSETGPAIFWNLAKLQIGDTITVTDDEGQDHTFIVDHIDHVTKESAPLENIFGASDVAHLNLITCSGTWNAALQRYDERVIVFTHLAS